MINVIAVLTCKPGMRDAVLKEFKANMAAVHAEKGCVEYAPVIDTPGMGKFQTQIGPDAFMVVEKWATPADLAAHAAAPHMVAYGAKVKEMLANRVIHVLSPA